MSQPNQNFKYFINAKRTVLVVSLVGQLNEADQHLLNACVNEIRAQKSVRFLVFNMQGLTGIETPCVRALAIVQGALREKYTLILCGLSSTTKKLLESAGIIRESELQKDLLTALQAIIKIEDQK